MTIGVGRGMNLNFSTLAVLMDAATESGAFEVGTVVETTGFHENKVKGHQSWARAMGLLDGTQLTPLSRRLLEHDPEFSDPRSRGACYVEIASNAEAEVAHHICNTILPSLTLDSSSLTTSEIMASLALDGVGRASRAIGQPRRDATRFLRSLESMHGFGVLGLIHRVESRRYSRGPALAGPELVGYAMARRWPPQTPYLRMVDAHRLAAPLLLSWLQFRDHLAFLERKGAVIRVTSSGLDQVRPATQYSPKDMLWPATMIS